MKRAPPHSSKCTCDGGTTVLDVECRSGILAAMILLVLGLGPMSNGTWDVCWLGSIATAKRMPCLSDTRCTHALPGWTWAWLGTIMHLCQPTWSPCFRWTLLMVMESASDRWAYGWIGPNNAKPTYGGSGGKRIWVCRGPRLRYRATQRSSICQVTYLSLYQSPF